MRDFIIFLGICSLLLFACSTKNTIEDELIPPENTSNQAETKTTDKTSENLNNLAINPKFNFKTEIKYKVISSESPRNFYLQTDNSFLMIKFEDKNSILDLFDEARANEGLAQFFKLIIEATESGYNSVTTWLAQFLSENFDKIILHISENSELQYEDDDYVPDEFKNSVIINLNLAEITEAKIISDIWKNFIPFDNIDIKTGIALLQPTKEVQDISFYYKFINSSRCLLIAQENLQLPSPYFSPLYNNVRADFTAFTLENSKDISNFYEIIKNQVELEKFHRDWIESREAIITSDCSIPKYFNAIIAAQKGQEKVSLNLLQQLQAKEFNIEDGGLYNLASLAFFACKYEFVRKYLEERFLPIEFYIKNESTHKSTRLFNQTETPLAILLAPLIQGDYNFNKRVAVFYDNLGFKLIADFLILAENIFDLDERIQKIADEDFILFIEKCPANYRPEFEFWFGYLKVLSKLRLNKINPAKSELDKILKLHVSKLQIEAASFLIESYSK